jgi:murein DD-endopeptidase MepM/ murein hydrolase activator NlpD
MTAAGEHLARGRWIPWALRHDWPNTGADQEIRGVRLGDVLLPGSDLSAADFPDPADHATGIFDALCRIGTASGDPHWRRRVPRGMGPQMVDLPPRWFLLTVVSVSVGMSGGLASAQSPERSKSDQSGDEPRRSSLIVDERTAVLIGPAHGDLTLDDATKAEAQRLASARAIVVSSSHRVIKPEVALSIAPKAVSKQLFKRAVSSSFGMRRHPLSGQVRLHSGVDIPAALGTPVLAAADGLVSTAGLRGGYGLLVTLEHKGGLQTRYAHMSAVRVSSGQRIKKGQVIGFVGSTGHSTGPHLHYETRIHGQAVDPLGR